MRHGPAGWDGVVDPDELHPDPPQTDECHPLGKEEPPPFPGHRGPPGPIRQPHRPSRGQEDGRPAGGHQQRLGGSVDRLHRPGVVETEQCHPDLVGPGPGGRRVTHEAEEQRPAPLALGHAVEGLELGPAHRRQLGLDLGHRSLAADVDTAVGAGPGAAGVVEPQMPHPLRRHLLGVIGGTDDADPGAPRSRPPVVRHLVGVPRPPTNFGDTPFPGS